MVTDTRLSDLVKGFGRTHAQAVWDAGLAAIATIDEIVREHDIDAGFEPRRHCPKRSESSSGQTRGRGLQQMRTFGYNLRSGVPATRTLSYT